jgi:hypothetical protein
MATPSLLRATSALILLLAAGCESLIGLEDRKLVAAQPGDDAGASDAGADAGEDAGDAPAPSLCDEYCASVLDKCTGNYAVYPSLEVCLAVCAQLPPGDEGDSEGNSVQCRLRAARQVTEQPADCPAAGPGGAGRCGENCESYCGLMDALCEAERLPDVDECIAKCAGLRDRDKLALEHDDSRYSAGALRARDHDGDTVQCRLVHVSLAAGPLGAEAQCWQAALAPRPEPETNADNPCLLDVNQEAVRCEDYCKLNRVACGGDRAVYESNDQCIAACEAMPLGEITDSGGQDTLGCRSTHSYNALVGDAETHCPHSGPTGSGVCGPDCPAFCTQLQSACGAGFAAEYGAGDAGLDACATACEPLLEGEGSLKYSVSDERIASLPELACRMRAAARAHEAGGDTDLCEQALGAAECE